MHTDGYAGFGKLARAGPADWLIPHSRLFPLDYPRLRHRNPEGLTGSSSAACTIEATAVERMMGLNLDRQYERDYPNHPPRPRVLTIPSARSSR